MKCDAGFDYIYSKQGRLLPNGIHIYIIFNLCTMRLPSINRSNRSIFKRELRPVLGLFLTVELQTHSIFNTCINLLQASWNFFQFYIASENAFKFAMVALVFPVGSEEPENVFWCLCIVGQGCGELCDLFRYLTVSQSTSTSTRLDSYSRAAAAHLE